MLLYLYGSMAAAAAISWFVSPMWPTAIATVVLLYLLAMRLGLAAKRREIVLQKPDELSEAAFALLENNYTFYLMPAAGRFNSALTSWVALVYISTGVIALVRFDWFSLAAAVVGTLICKPLTLFFSPLGAFTDRDRQLHSEVVAFITKRRSEAA